MLGPAKTSATLTSFEAELETRLSSGDVEPSRRTLFMGDAHVITAVAGDKSTGHAQQTNSFRLTGHDEESKAFANEPIDIV